MHPAVTQCAGEIFKIFLVESTQNLLMALATKELAIEIQVKNSNRKTFLQVLFFGDLRAE